MSRSDFLIELLVSRRQIFTDLARIWLESGATSFTVWHTNGRLMAHWPEGTPPAPTTYRAPILIDNAEIGCIAVADSQEFVPHRNERLKIDAMLLTKSIRPEEEWTRLMTQLIDTQTQLRLMLRMTQAARSHVDIDQVADSMIRTAYDLLDVEYAFALYQTEKQLFFRWYNKPFPVEFALKQYLSGTKKSHSERLINRNDTAIGLPRTISSLFIIPIDVDTGINISLGLINKKVSKFTESEIEMARAIAEHAGAQMENITLHSRIVEQTKLQTEMKLAQNVQLQLIPQQLPPFAGLDLYAHSRPASQVGGDFYDVHKIEEQQLAFTVGDVAGKGMPAALLMAITRTVLRSKLNTLHVQGPAAILDAAAGELYDDFLQVSMFSTTFVGIFDAAKCQLIYANAGHSPVIYRPVRGEAHLINAEGPPLGVMQSSLTTNNVQKLESGDCFLVLTDGFSEAHNPEGEMFGYERLLRLIDSLIHLPAAEIALALLDAIHQFTAGDGAQGDDQTLLVLKVD